MSSPPSKSYAAAAKGAQDASLAMRSVVPPTPPPSKPAKLTTPLKSNSAVRDNSAASNPASPRLSRASDQPTPSLKTATVPKVTKVPSPVKKPATPKTGKASSGASTVQKAKSSATDRPNQATVAASTRTRPSAKEEPSASPTPVDDGVSASSQRSTLAPKPKPKPKPTPVKKSPSKCAQDCGVELAREVIDVDKVPEAPRPQVKQAPKHSTKKTVTKFKPGNVTVEVPIEDAADTEEVETTDSEIVPTPLDADDSMYRGRAGRNRIDGSATSSIIQTRAAKARDIVKPPIQPSAPTIKSAVGVESSSRDKAPAEHTHLKTAKPQKTTRAARNAKAPKSAELVIDSDDEVVVESYSATTTPKRPRSHADVTPHPDDSDTSSVLSVRQPKRIKTDVDDSDIGDEEGNPFVDGQAAESENDMEQDNADMQQGVAHEPSIDCNETLEENLDEYESSFIDDEEQPEDIGSDMDVEDLGPGSTVNVGEADVDLDLEYVDPEDGAESIPKGDEDRISEYEQGSDDLHQGDAQPPPHTPVSERRPRTFGASFPPAPVASTPTSKPTRTFGQVITGESTLQDLEFSDYVRTPPTTGKCGAMEGVVEDAFLKEEAPYVDGEFDPLHPGSYTSWNDLAAKPQLMFRGWAQTCAHMNLDNCLAVVGLKKYKQFINLSRARTRDVSVRKIPGKKVRYHLYLSDRRTPAVALSTVMCTTSHLLRPPLRGLTRKSIEGIHHSVEWERQVAFVCGAFGHESLDAQLSQGAMTFMTRAEWKGKADSDRSPDKRESHPDMSAMFGAALSPSINRNAKSAKYKYKGSEVEGFELEHDAEIPVYDCRHLNFQIQDLDRLGQLPRWTEEIPYGSFVVPAYTITVYRTGESTTWSVSYNIQFAIIFGIPGRP